MSRVLLVTHCADCPLNEQNWRDNDTYGDWCSRARRPIDLIGGTAFPDWCPLPEEGKEESK